jgi:hypothetical protein
VNIIDYLIISSYFHLFLFYIRPSLLRYKGVDFSRRGANVKRVRERFLAHNLTFLHTAVTTRPPFVLLARMEYASHMHDPLTRQNLGRGGCMIGSFPSMCGLTERLRELAFEFLKLRHLMGGLTELLQFH